MKSKLSNRILRFIVLYFILSIGSLISINAQEPLILDMVHHNPGEAPYKTAYNNPAVIKEMGYNGKVFFLFESPALAINWESVDPDILPIGSEERIWVDKKAAQIHEMHKSCKAEKMKIYAMSDLVLFPKRLIAKYGIEETFGDPNNLQVQTLIRAQIDEMFTQFPDLDGLVVRIGETYLHDAPYHKGHINDKQNAQNTIIPLMQILREEICVKYNKKLIFRTWLAFDRNLKTYLKVSDAVEPHPNLIISVKHCENDFHRANWFSKVIGAGRHKQIIEVQCSREYEGKGAYPNYIANGVIEGFEEHNRMPAEEINSIREFTEKKPDLYAGIWTWTRGGGWSGPYIQNELWSDLNAWVMAQWAADPSQTEESIFNRYAIERLHLQGNDVASFRKLCLLSAEAVVRGRCTTHRDINPWWTRDMGIGWPEVPQDEVGRKRNLEQKDEAVEKWEEIVKLAQKIHWDDDETREHVIGSSYYGLHLYEIYRSIVYLSHASAQGDLSQIKKWIRVYDEAWSKYESLPDQFSLLSTLYTKDYKIHNKRNADEEVELLREKL